jgi:hypothetical protein
MESKVDLSPSSTEILSGKINALIDRALEKENAAQERRTYLGASRIGVECERRLGYEYHGHDGDPFPGKAIRRFRLGHIHEDETVRWLHMAGFVLRTHKEDGSQFGFSVADGKFAGHTDGVLMGGPDIGLAYPGQWEHKIAKASSYAGMAKHGIKKAQPTYYAQAQIYMRQFSLAWCLFTVLNSDTSELLFEIIPYVAAEAEALIEKAARIIESASPMDLPRIASVETDYRCRFCPFKGQCWAAPKASLDAPKPNWLRP